jgi:hypothetical protein
VGKRTGNERRKQKGLKRTRSRDMSRSGEMKNKRRGSGAMKKMRNLINKCLTGSLRKIPNLG